MDDGSLIGGGGGSGYSKLSTKSPDLSNDLVWFFPGSSQKQLIVLFHFRAAMANFCALLNNLVWIFGKKSLLNEQYYLFFKF